MTTLTGSLCGAYRDMNEVASARRRCATRRSQSTYLFAYKVEFCSNGRYAACFRSHFVATASSRSCLSSLESPLRRRPWVLEEANHSVCFQSRVADMHGLHRAMLEGAPQPEASSPDLVLLDAPLKPASPQLHSRYKLFPCW